MKTLTGSEAKTTYHAFCQEEWELPIFAQDWYLDHCCVKGTWEVIVVLHDDRVIASYTYFVKRKWSFRYVTMPLFVKWMGLYIASSFRTPKWESRLIRQLLPHLPNVDRLQQNFFPHSFNWSPFYWKGFQQTTYYTYRLYLETDKEKLFSAIRYNMRRSIRQADFYLDTSVEPEEFYSINKLSFDRQRVPLPYSFADFLAHYDTLQAYKRCQLLGARNSLGELCGVCLVIWDNTTCYYHFSGDHPAFRKQSVGIWMIWQAILFAYEHLDVSIFDFEGSMLEGVAAVKQRFQAEAIPYYFISKNDHVVFRLLSALSIIRHQ